jgi:competence protein ComEC
VKRWAVGVIAARLPETSAALLAGLLLGERSTLPREIDESFRRAGVYHILAVSGFNVALLAGGVRRALACVASPRGRRRRGRCRAAGFALVVGGQPSVLRAS